MADPINPEHYMGAGGWQSIDVIEAFVPDKPHRWAALKYLFRAGKKDPAKEVEDLRKAVWWIEREIKHLTPKPIQITEPTGDCQQEAVYMAGTQPAHKLPCGCTPASGCLMDISGDLTPDAFCKQAEGIDNVADPYSKAWTPWST